MKANIKDMTEDEWMNYREAGDGESYDRNGNVRPVPAGVPMRPDN